MQNTIVNDIAIIFGFKSRRLPVEDAQGPAHTAYQKLPMKFYGAIVGGRIDDMADVLREYPEAAHWSFFRTPAICVAAMYGHADAVHLLHAYGADINAQDVRGMTPLMHAVSCPQGEEAQNYLLTQKDTNLRLKDKHGRTVWKYALAKGGPASLFMKTEEETRLFALTEEINRIARDVQADSAKESFAPAAEAPEPLAPPPRKKKEIIL